MDTVEKFEFQKLKLPKKGDEQIKSPPYHDIIITQEKAIKRYKTLIFIFTFILSLVLISYIYLLSKKKVTEKKQSLEVSKVVTDSIPNKSTHQQPVYRNFFDSIVFLNEIKTEKIVVSKGIDEYLHQERLIIKSGDNYYNCYCSDLIKYYKVGDKIP